jgi:hypothetical protein
LSAHLIGSSPPRYETTDDGTARFKVERLVDWQPESMATASTIPEVNRADKDSDFMAET